jgi:hypothetical protein
MTAPFRSCRQIAKSVGLNPTSFVGATPTGSNVGVAQQADALSSNLRLCRCKSCRRYQLWKLNLASVPDSFAKRNEPLGVWSASLPASAIFKQPVGETGSRLPYKQKSSEHHVHGLPCSCSLKKTARFINSIALDVGRMSARYRPGAPI